MQRHAFIIGLAGVLSACLFASNLTAQTAPAPPSPRDLFGDWALRCETLPGAPQEQCALNQTVKADDQPNVGLVITIGFLGAPGTAAAAKDKKTPLMLVVAPLGVFLPGGLGLRVDDVMVGVTEFWRCSPNGCLAEVTLNEDLLTKFKTGKTANFIIFQTPEDGIGIPISLNGFAQGYGRIAEGL